MWRMKHSLMAVVREPKARPEVPADEQQLRQAKDWFKWVAQGRLLGNSSGGSHADGAKACMLLLSVL